MERERGERCRDWKEAAIELTTERYPQYQVDDPLSCLSFCPHFEPRRWVALCFSDTGLKSMDLVAHELRLLVETLRASGSYD